jgi:hypothetical protein
MKSITRKAGLAGVVASLAVVMALSVASPALAAPKGIFARFAKCPTTFPGVTLCTFSEITSGEFKIGKTAVPINKTITLQGGALKIHELEYVLIPATDGNSLSKTELNVPGGLSGLVNCTEIKGEGFFEKGEREICKAIFENSFTGVTATTELAANEHNPAILNLAAIVNEEGTGLTLPVKIHLKNPLLGESCYIGSEASPIQLHLTDGKTSPPPPNKSITGSLGTEENEFEALKGGEEGVVTLFKNQSLVDNAFSVPVAAGCGGFFSFLIDPIINAKLGLPSAAGNNTAIQTGTTWLAKASQVKASE